MLLSLLLSSCIVEEPEENHRPTRGIYETFEYVRNANRPMLDALFITYRMQEYNRLQTDSARQAFRKTYLRDMTVKDTVSKENSINKATVHGELAIMSSIQPPAPTIHPGSCIGPICSRWPTDSMSGAPT